MGSWVVDLRTRSVHWSDELYRIFGLAPGEVAPSAAAVLERIHPDDRQRVSWLDPVSAPFLAPAATTCRIVRPSGEIRTAQLQADLASASPSPAP